MPRKNPKLLEGSWQSTFKSQLGVWGAEIAGSCDQLVHNYLIG